MTHTNRERSAAAGYLDRGKFCNDRGANPAHHPDTLPEFPPQPLDLPEQIPPDSAEPISPISTLDHSNKKRG